MAPGYGEFCLLASCFSEIWSAYIYQGVLQENLYPKTEAWDIMLGVNLWGTIYNMIYMFGLPQGIGFEAYPFCKQHDQNFIFMTISYFGSLANTTKKFVSIVVLSVMSVNPLSLKQ